MSIGSLPPSVVYRMAEKSESSNLERTRSNASIRRTVEDFEARVARVQTVDDVFRDRRLLNFMMEATGNASELNQVGIVRRALSAPADDNNVAKRMGKGQLFGAAAFFELSKGVDKLKSPKIIRETIDSYIATQSEKSLSQNVSEVTRARYFAKNIAEAAEDPFKILGDGLLRSVITKTLGLPDQMAVQSVETQARAITSRLDLSKFKDKAFTEKFIQRYLNIADQEARAAGGAASSPTLALFGGGGGVNDLFGTINALGSNRINIVV